MSCTFNYVRNYIHMCSIYDLKRWIPPKSINTASPILALDWLAKPQQINIELLKGQKPWSFWNMAVLPELEWHGNNILVSLQCNPEWSYVFLSSFTSGNFERGNLAQDCTVNSTSYSFLDLHRVLQPLHRQHFPLLLPPSGLSKAGYTYVLTY